MSRVRRYSKVDDSPENLEAGKRLDLERHVCGLAMPICALAMCVLLSSVAFDPTPKFTLSVAAGVEKVPSGDIRCTANSSLVTLRRWKTVQERHSDAADERTPFL